MKSFKSDDQISQLQLVQREDDDLFQAIDNKHGIMAGGVSSCVQKGSKRAGKKPKAKQNNNDNNYNNCRDKESYASIFYGGKWRGHMRTIVKVYEPVNNQKVKKVRFVLPPLNDELDFQTLMKLVRTTLGVGADVELGNLTYKYRDPDMFGFFSPMRLKNDLDMVCFKMTATCYGRAELYLSPA